MLAVDSSTLALPYWDYSKDTETGDCYEKACYIFSNDYFGGLYGNSEENFAVTDGLFAYWPITEWTSRRFGKLSPLKNFDCPKLQYFTGTTASVCERCCGQDDCTCKKTDNYKTWVRNHDDCTPFMARNPDEVSPIDGSRELMGTPANFVACTNPEYINNYMEWQNCIEFEQLSCIFYLAGINCTAAIDGISPPDGFPIDLVPTSDKICQECTLEAFYFNTSNVKQFLQPLHSQAHIRLGRDIQDVTTSPTDVGVFTGYHANIDRSHMTWMMNSYDLYSQNYWGYPDNQNDWAIVNVDRLSGPWSNYDALICADPKKFNEYTELGSAWLNGTLLDDTCNEGFPFDDLWESPPENGLGYTHQEIIYWSDPSRTIYTYDTLADNYDYS
jgi:hypothetical protein